MPTEITGACGATVCGTHGTTRRVDTTVRCPPPLRASCPAPGTALRLPARTVRLRHGVHVHAGRCRAHADRPRTLAGRQRVRAGRPGKAGVRCSNQLVLWPGEHCGHVSVKAIVIGQLQEGSGVHGAGLHAQLNATPDTQPLFTLPETVPAPFSERRRGNTSVLRAPERNGAFQPRSLAIPWHLMGQEARSRRATCQMEGHLRGRGRRQSEH